MVYNSDPSNSAWETPQNGHQSNIRHCYLNIDDSSEMTVLLMMMMMMMIGVWHKMPESTIAKRFCPLTQMTIVLEKKKRNKLSTFILVRKTRTQTKLYRYTHPMCIRLMESTSLAIF